MEVLSRFRGFLMNRSEALDYYIRKMLALQRRNTRASRLAARLISNHLQRSFGVHVSVLVGEYGTGVRMPHPVGIVIGDGAIIEDGVTILQNVTIGRRNDADPSNPRIRRNAKLQAGAVIVGPITIGESAIVGANSVVLHDVRDFAIVVGAPAKEIGERPR